MTLLGLTTGLPARVFPAWHRILTEPLLDNEMSDRAPEIMQPKAGLGCLEMPAPRVEPANSSRASSHSPLLGDVGKEIDKCLDLGGKMTVDRIIDGHWRSLRHVLIEDRNDNTGLKILAQQPPSGVDNA